MPKAILQDTLWAGTEASLEAHMKNLETADQRMALMGNVENPDMPRLLEVKDGVGLVSIKGALSNRDSFMSFLMGASTYPAIREALMYAATSADVKHILLDIDSGGGSVAGVSDVSNLISMINSKVKPVTAFTDGTMMSAAYWLGSSAGKVYSSKTAAVGSIGVISTHMEQSKRLKDEGIGVTVMRAGKYKALANSVEPLTQDAKDQIQASLDAAYEVFVEHVASARNVSYAVADKQMAQGQEFFGQGAMDAGLVDGIMSFDAVMTNIMSDIDKKTHITQNRAKSTFPTGMSGSTEETNMPRKALTDQQIAELLASGGQAAVDAALASTDPTDTVDPAAADPAPAAEGSAPVAPEASADNSSLVAYLQTQIKDLTEASVAMKVELASTKTKLSEAEAAVTGLQAIAAKSVNAMHIALGGSARDLEGQSPTAVIAEHARVSAEFVSKFKAGGVAAVDAAAPKPVPASVSPMHMARVNAARFPTK